MKKTTVRVTFAIIAVAYVASHFLGHAHAASSLGIGNNDAITTSTGPFAHWMQWINVRQQEFYR